jgi:AcrR family transcriptional regulator
MLNSEARERVLEAAEQLFAEKGYAAVKLKDIAAAVGIRHATLYHHVPAGKEELYIEVTERALRRHRHGIEEIVARNTGNLQAQLQGVADWLLGHPPMDFIRMVKSDMPTIDTGKAAYLSQLALESLIEPIASTLYQARDRGEIEHQDLGLVAGGLFGMFESMHLIPKEGFGKTRHEMVNELINVFLYGLVKR